MKTRKRLKSLLPVIDDSQLKMLLEEGWTDTQISKFYGVQPYSFSRLKQKNPDFKKKVEDWRQAANKKVERTLYERAMGVTVREVKIQTDSKGKETRIETIKELPPDTGAIIFYLKNRMPDRWKEKQPEELQQLNITINRKEFKRLK